MRIKELAERSGLTAPTIRYYEQEGLLDTRHVSRKDNNYREYRETAVEHLYLLGRLQAAGFTIRELTLITKSGGLDQYSLEQQIEHLHIKLEEVGKKKAELMEVENILSVMLANKIAQLRK